MLWPALPRCCRAHHLPVIRSNLCRSTPQPPNACRSFARLEFRHDRSKANSKQYSGKTNKEFCYVDCTDPLHIRKRSPTRCRKAPPTASLPITRILPSKCGLSPMRLGFTDLLHTPERTRGGRSEPQAAILTVEAW